MADEGDSEYRLQFGDQLEQRKHELPTILLQAYFLENLTGQCRIGDTLP